LSIRHNPATGNPVTVESNYILDNQSPRLAGGVWIYGVSPVTFTNNVIADNFASRDGSGMYVTGDDETPASVLFIHNTVANNAGGGRG